MYNQEGNESIKVVKSESSVRLLLPSHKEAILKQLNAVCVDIYSLVPRG